MFKMLLCTCAIIFSGMCMAKNVEQPPFVLVLKAKNESGLPKNFRSTAHGFIKQSDKSLPSIEGLKELNMLGSSQFSEKGLESILKELDYPKNLYIVDLRQESHGFLNGSAVAWYAARNAINAGKTLDQLTQSEKILLQEALEKKDVIVGRVVGKDKLGTQAPQVENMPMIVTSVSTEEALVSKFGAHYVRFPVRDAQRATDEIVDQFVTFTKNLPKDAWVLFHCSAGAGRTTSFMIMYDSIRNAKKVSYDDIYERQMLIGGHNIANFGDSSSWKYAYSVERDAFLKDFYQYCRTNEDNYTTSWSTFIKKHTLAKHQQK